MNHTESFEKRNSIDIAETKCKEFLDAKGITWTQFGFDCRGTVSGRDFSKIDWRLKCKPDFMVFKNQPILLECKGFRDVLKLKLDDIEAYDWWAEFHPMSCFLYSTETNKHYIVDDDFYSNYDDAIITFKEWVQEIKKYNKQLTKKEE